MGALQAKENIWWVGVQDPDLRVFDIVMYSEYGTSYNAYVVKGAEKTAVFETVKAKFFDQYLENLKEVCDPATIDYIVVGHTEPDHAGGVEKLLALAPNATVVGSATALTFLKEIVNHPFKSQVVTEKDQIDLGGMHLEFLSVPFLHWPDSMYTYIPEAKALFTVDSFGCHYSDDRVFNDQIEGDFEAAYKYYFDNIMGPFKPFVLKALNRIKDLDIEFIGNGHGPVLRTNIQHYFDLYRKWATPVKKAPEDRNVVIAYVSAYGYTKQLAETIAEGLADGGVQHIQMFDLVTDDNAAAKAALQSSDGFLLGSPTLVGDALPPDLRDAGGPEPHHPPRPARRCLRQLRLERRGGTQPDRPHGGSEAGPAPARPEGPLQAQRRPAGRGPSVRPRLRRRRAEVSANPESKQKGPMRFASVLFLCAQRSSASCWGISPGMAGIPV